MQPQLILHYSINITDLNQNVLFSYNNYDSNNIPEFMNSSQIMVVTLTTLIFNTYYQLSLQAQNCNGTVSSIVEFSKRYESKCIFIRICLLSKQMSSMFEYYSNTNQ